MYFFLSVVYLPQNQNCCGGQDIAPFYIWYDIIWYDTTNTNNAQKPVKIWRTVWQHARGFYGSFRSSPLLPTHGNLGVRENGSLLKARPDGPTTWSYCSSVTLGVPREIARKEAADLWYHSGLKLHMYHIKGPRLHYKQSWGSHKTNQPYYSSMIAMCAIYCLRPFYPIHLLFRTTSRAFACTKTHTRSTLCYACNTCSVAERVKRAEWSIIYHTYYKVHGIFTFKPLDDGDREFESPKSDFWVFSWLSAQNNSGKRFFVRAPQSST